jgi:hypothetical protein
MQKSSQAAFYVFHIYFPHLKSLAVMNTPDRRLLNGLTEMRTEMALTKVYLHFSIYNINLNQMQIKLNERKIVDFLAFKSRTYMPQTPVHEYINVLLNNINYEVPYNVIICILMIFPLFYVNIFSRVFCFKHRQSTCMSFVSGQETKYHIHIKNRKNCI